MKGFQARSVRFSCNAKGVSVTEYAVLLALLTVLSLGALLGFGTQIGTGYRNADRTLEIYNESVASANAQYGVPSYDDAGPGNGNGNGNIYARPGLRLVVDTQHVAGNTVGLPLAVGAGGGVDVQVDWGDGTVESFNTPGLVTHDYAAPGEYTVEISGILAHYGEVYGTGSQIGTYNQAVEQVIDFGTTDLVSLEMAFSNADNLTSVASLPNSVTDMSFAFESIDGSLPDVTGLNVGNVQQFNGMFAFTPNFNQDISGWSTGSAVDMGLMFYQSPTFNQPIGSWNTGNVVSMYGMFRDATAFNQPIGTWDVSSVSNMGYMFQKASSFNQPLNSWNTSSLTGVSYMFNEATVFNQDLDNWDVSGVSAFFLMFKDAHAFNGDVSTWNVGTATVFQGMFNTAQSFNGDLSGWDMSSAQNLAFMFDKAYAFSGDISGWNVSNVLYTNGMFRYTHNFNTDISGWNTSSLVAMRGMFWGAQAFNQPIGVWDVSNVSDFMRTFRETSVFDQDLSAWDTSSGTRMDEIFRNAAAFDRDLSTWNFSSVNNFNDFGLNSSFSVANYDALLISLAGQTVLPNQIFDMNAQYSAAAQTARDSLVAQGWVITDNGLQ